jgi:hypothetical protein
MARNRHSFAKRQKELEKKRKADEKRERRRSKGNTPDAEEALTNEADSPGL